MRKLIVEVYPCKANLKVEHRWFRHPSYAGFYYWALGTQLVLQNPLTFILFSILLWNFFYKRTRGQRDTY